MGAEVKRDSLQAKTRGRSSLKILMPLVLAMLCGCMPPASAQPRTVWQIGKFDYSSQEFSNEGIDYSALSAERVYTIGKSHTKDWIGFQPGPANAVAGGRLHPFRVDFDLNPVRHHLYELHLGILYETPRLSALQLSVNGHQGIFFFHPHLDYHAGDWAGTFVPQTSYAEKTIEIPTRWLRRGLNQLIFTAVDDPAKPQWSRGDIAPGQSGIVYDAIAFTEDQARSYHRGEVSAWVRPTIFYRQGRNGLQEIVDVCPDLHFGADTHSRITLSIQGRNYTHPLVIRGEFGEAEIRFAVPQWHGSVPATLTIDGHRFAETLRAAKKWTLDIVPQEHLDIGFTDYAPKVAELQSESVDGVLKLLKRYPDFRWSLDGSWVAEQYLADRSAAQKARFLSAVRAGQIVLPAQYANQLTGAVSLEGLIRMLYYSHSLSKKYDLPVGAANITDVPSYSWSYASVLHDAGIKYLAAGSNSWRAPVLLLGRWNEKSPFYWEGPDGGRVMMWYSRAYLQLASLYGTPPTIPAVEQATPIFLQAYTRPDYVAHSVIIFGSQLENTPLSRAQARLPSEWAKHYAYPRMVFTTFEAAMASLKKQFHGRLKVYRGDFGPYWEDGFTSDAYHTAIFRRSQERILSAEKMSTLPALLDPVLRPDRSRLQNAWKNMLLFGEHTWSAANGTTRPQGDQYRRQLEQKDMESLIARNDIAKTIEQSWAQLESLLDLKQESILVFNSLSWKRSGWLEVDLPVGQRIVDPKTKLAVPQQVVRREAGTPLPGFGGPTNRVRFEAAGVPAMGYRQFVMAPAVGSHAFKAQPYPDAGKDLILENAYYRVRLDLQHGAIKSIYDRQLHRELVNRASRYAFGAYVYVEGGDHMPENSLYRFGSAQVRPKLKPMESGKGKLVSIRRTAQGITAVLISSAPNTPSIRTTVTLLSNEKEIEISYRVHKIATFKKEAAYFAFPFAGRHPVFRYETQNGWVNPAKDELIGGCREWYAVNHWAAVTSGGVTAAIIPEDAPIITFGSIVRGRWPIAFHPATSTVFSWIMSNYWDTNYASSQGGDFTFRYRIVSTAGFDGQNLTRLGWEAMTPLESDMAGATSTRHQLEQPSAGFLSISPASVAVIAWDLDSKGDDSVLRLEEIAGKSEAVHLQSSFLTIEKAWICNALLEKERELKPGPDGLHFQVRPFGIVTLRLKTEPKFAEAGGKS